MNKDIKNKWVKALRSGKYKQARGALKKGNAYCCLGVLCDLWAKENKKDFPLNNAGVLPFKVEMWADVNSEDPVVKDKSGNVLPLSRFNDGVVMDCNKKRNKQRTFKQIANYIENSL